MPLELISEVDRRKILRVLAEEPKTVKDKEVAEALRKSYSINLKYRKSVFKALERLVEADLAEILINRCFHIILYLPWVVHPNFGYCILGIGHYIPFLLFRKLLL